MDKGINFTNSRGWPERKEKYMLIFYLTFFFLVAASVALFQPIADTPPLFGNPPDEHARYLIPQYICKYGRIPNGYEEAVRIPSYGFSYAFYNVFPYIIQGFAMRFVNLFTDSEMVLLYTARFINVLSGTAMAAVVFGIGRRVFSDRRFCWLFCFAVMYLPQSLFVHTYVNTDSMCLLSTALMVYGLVRSYQEGFTYKNCLWLSAGIILCALSYYNAYGFILSSILLFIVYFSGSKDGRLTYDYKDMLKKGCFLSIIVLAGIGWWFIRSYVLYDGDFLGLKTRELCAARYAVDAVNPLSNNTYQARGYTVWQMLKETNFYDSVFIGFVAAYGSMSIKGNIWFYHLYKLFFYAGLAGYGVSALAGLFQRKRISFKKIFFHLNMILCIVMPVVLVIHYSYTMDFQPQGRYILPIIVPLMYYITAGARELLQLLRIRGKLLDIGIKLMLCWLVISLAVMVYGYAFPVYLSVGM